MAQALACSLCDGSHLTKACSFPQEIRRCLRCQLPIFDQNEHNCNILYAAKSFYTDIVAKETFPLFRFTFGGPIYFLDDNNVFSEVCDGQALICGATDGMFTINLMESFTSMLLQCHRQLFNLDNQFGPIDLPPEFKLNTTAVFGILPDLDAVRIQIGFAVYAKSVDNDHDTFDRDGGTVEWPQNSVEVITLKTIFKFYSSYVITKIIYFWIDQECSLFDMERFENGIDDNFVKREFIHKLEPKTNVEIQSNIKPTSLTQPCFNCGKLHSDGDCNIPTYLVRCPRCWIVSFDRTGHRKPCTPTNTTSSFRSNIFGQMAQPLFKFRVRKGEADIFYMDPNKNVFEMVNGKKLLSPATCGVFAQKELDDYHLISYNATMYSRFSFLIAICVNGIWRVRFRAIVTPVNGLLLFKCKQVGNEDIFSAMLSTTNTVAVYGFKPKTNAMKIDFRVFAADKGGPNNDDYTGSMQWRCRDGYFDETLVDDVLDGKSPKAVKLFDRNLYHNFKDLSLAQQEFN